MDNVHVKCIMTRAHEVDIMQPSSLSAFACVKWLTSMTLRRIKPKTVAAVPCAHRTWRGGCPGTSGLHMQDESQQEPPRNRKDLNCYTG
eukprot:6187189-Pleurochrysis_carterae.AAC.2